MTKPNNEKDDHPKYEVGDKPIDEEDQEWVDWEKLDEMSDIDLSNYELDRLGRVRGQFDDEDDLDEWLDDDDE